MPALTDADKVLRNDTGKDIVDKLDAIAGAIAQGGGGGSSTLAGLNDVNLTSPSNEQVLKYNSTTGKWENANESGGGGTNDYNNLSNKPQINSVSLQGNKSLDDLGIQPVDIISTASGTIATFNDGGDNIPMKSCEVAIVAQQASRTPSPSNPLPITGFSSISVPVVGGKNLFGGSDGVNYPLIIPANKTFTLSCSAGGGKLEYFRKDGTLIDYYFFGNTNPRTITCPETIYSVTLTTVNNPYVNAQIEFANAPTTYEAFKANNITAVSLGQTIYGGTAELVGGNGVVEYELITLTGQETGANYAWNSYTFVNTLFDGSNDAKRTILCSHTNNHITGLQMYNTRATSDYPNACCISVGSNVRFRNNACTSLADYQTWLQQQVTNGTPVQILAKLATPTPFSFTPESIPTLSGENNIYSNCGDVEVEYFNENAYQMAELVESYGSYIEIIGTLTAGQTSITFTDSRIKMNSTIDVYTDSNVDYNSITSGEGSITIVFDAQENDLGVKVRLS